MTRLLASVTNVSEAMAAMAAGADLIDLKNPREGALGALPEDVIREVVVRVQGRRPISATVGDLPMQPAMLVTRVCQITGTGVDFVKVGFFGREGHAECVAGLAPLAASGIRIVAVMFADQEPDFSLLPALLQAGFHGVMLDTAVKEGRRLTDWLDLHELCTFVAQARRYGLLCGLAGSLVLEDVARLSACRPDYLGFRGALCESGDRCQRLDPMKVATAAELLRECNNSARASGLTLEA